MRFFKLWMVVPLIVISLVLSTTTPIHAARSSFNLYAYDSSVNTYKAVSLSDIEKIIQEAMAKRQNTVVIKYKGKTYKLLDIISEYIAKTIEADEYLNYSYRSVNMSYKAYGTDITITLKFTYYESADEIKYVDQKVRTILSQIIRPGMNDHEKVKAVHDYLVLNLAYDTRLINNSPYPALTEGVTACNGYAMLAYKMLKELGIEVRLISGVASSQAFNTQNHAWNMVKLDGNWYHLDVTWDDPVPDEAGRILYDYYLLTDKEIAKNHSWKTGGINGEEKPYPTSSTPYFTMLQSKLNTTSEADRYLNLINAIDLKYLLPQYTAKNLTELSEMIKKEFANYNKDFSIRYINANGDLKANLQKLIYNNAVEKKVKSWSYAATHYVRGTSPYEQLINISDVVYQQAPPKQPAKIGVTYPTPGFKSIGSFVNVDKNKFWTIQFDGAVNPQSISTDHIYILNSKGEKLTSIEFSLKDENNLLIKNKKSFNPGETYFLYVKNMMESVFGEPLRESVSIKFTIRM